MTVNGTVATTQASRARSTAEAAYCAVVTRAAEGLGLQSMMMDLGLSAQVRAWTDSDAGDCVKKRPWEDQTCGIEILVAAGGDQIRKGTDEAGTRRATFGGPHDEGKVAV